MIEREFWPLYVAGCARIGVAPLDLLAVAANESGLNPHAWNEGGRAGGLWQLTPPGAGAAGWPKDQTHRFSALTASEQWPFWETYFGRHRGQLGSRAACYVCTGWPAGLSIAGNPDALLCSEDGRTDIPVPHEYAHLWKWPEAEVRSWYHGNRGFDRGHTGEIRVRDLTAAIDRSTLALGGVWSDAVAAVQREQARVRDTQPEVIVAPDNQPIYVSPEPTERDPEAA